MNSNNDNLSNKRLDIPFLNYKDDGNNNEQDQDDKYKNFDYDENINIDNILYSNRKTLVQKSNSLNKRKNNKEPLFQKFDSRKTYNDTQS